MFPVNRAGAALAQRTARRFAMGILLLNAISASRSDSPALAPARGAHAGADLTVTAAEFRNKKGHARFALFTTEDSWLNGDKAFRVAVAAIDSTAVTTVFHDLPPGVYAASVFHDEDDNGKLDMRYLPFPKLLEGAGVSNNATRRFGPPRWRDATFTVADTAAAITIVLRY
jgi:uncharacterized protein (DUF2141 family)